MRLWVLGLIFLTGCGDQVSTLYRSSLYSANARIHVASFDAADGLAYNTENCNRAADLFAAQPGVQTRFWCEIGPYRK